MLAKVQTWVADLDESFDTKVIGARIESVLQGIDELTNSQDLRETLAGINRIVNQQDTQQLTATLQATLTELQTAASDASQLLLNADSKLDTLEIDIKPVIDRVVGVLDEAKVALEAAKFQLLGESIESSQLGSTLKEVEGAARALRQFLDYLERNPEAVLQGKKQ